jgi:hypothetical protein
MRAVKSRTQTAVAMGKIGEKFDQDIALQGNLADLLANQLCPLYDSGLATPAVSGF